MWYVRIGSKLRGPFTEDQLKLLRKRGELSSVHQVSQDQRTWEHAGALFQKWENGVVKPIEDVPKVPERPSDDEWFFSSPIGESIGPMSQQQLLQLATAGQITARTLVYGPGYSEWTAAGKIDFLKSSTKKASNGLALPIALVTCLSLALIGTAGYVFILARPPSDSTDETPEDTYSNAAEQGEPEDVSRVNKLAPAKKLVGPAIKINSVNQPQIKDALARVQIIKRVHFDNGSIVELPIAHGTGFCVTPSGYFLTNRHVVDPYSDVVDQITLNIDGKPRPVKRDMAIILFIHGIRFEAKLIHVSSRFDLAVVKTDRLQALPYFELSTKNEPALLMEVYALGFPGVAAAATTSEEAGLSAKFESEYVRAVADKCTVTAESQLPESSFGHSAVPGSITKTSRTDTGQLFVYHSAPIFGGNSGGPLVDKKGLVVGINTAIRRDLEVKEVTLSDGSKGVMAINDGNLNQAFLASQFRDELKAYVPEKLHWK